MRDAAERRGARIRGGNLVLKGRGRQGGWPILGNRGWKCPSAVEVSASFLRDLDFTSVDTIFVTEYAVFDGDSESVM